MHLLQYARTQLVIIVVYRLQKPTTQTDYSDVAYDCGSGLDRVDQ